MATNANRIEGRRAERRRADAPSTVRGQASGPLDAIVRDVSLTGACVECSSDLALGELVSVGIGGVGALRAMVVWRRESFYGLDFVVSLTSGQMERAFAAQTVVPFTAVPPNAMPAARLEDENEGEGDGVYAEATGWLSTLLVMVAGGTAIGVALLHGWLF